LTEADASACRSAASSVSAAGAAVSPGGPMTMTISPLT
jgi:hypothetical protein